MKSFFDEEEGNPKRGTPKAEIIEDSIHDFQNTLIEDNTYIDFYKMEEDEIMKYVA